ncbi:MAG: SpoIIE family protein phosphatase [Lentisphaeria bacterium]|nr:SpoIIE family protein phosphatase [Lentisphaeria bacterium]
MSFWTSVIVLICVVAIVVLSRRLFDRYRTLLDSLDRERRSRAADIAFLNEFTRKLADVTEAADAMDMVLHHVLDVLQAESVGIYLVEEEDGNRRLRGAACTGTFPAFEQPANVQELMRQYPRQRSAHFPHELIPPGQGLIARAALDTGPVLVGEPDPAAEALLPRSVRCLIATPMQIEHRVTGVVVAVNCREESRRFEERDRDLLAALSCQAALASNLIRVYAERARQERMVQEIRIARELQQSLLPAPLTEWGSFRLTVCARPALEVAGDYYDYVPIDQDRLLVIVADATGKGVAACVLMAICRSVAHVAADSYQGMEQFLREMNRRLFVDTDRSRFVTLAATVLDRRRNTVEYGCAGHTPMLVRHADGSTETVRCGGTALGLLPPALAGPFESRSLDIPPGTSFLLFSDGLTEALNRTQEEFGLPRLEALWRDHALPLEPMRDLIIERVAAFEKDQGQADDQTLLLFELAGPAADTQRPARGDPQAPPL